MLKKNRVDFLSSGNAVPMEKEIVYWESVFHSTLSSLCATPNFIPKTIVLPLAVF